MSIVSFTVDLDECDFEEIRCDPSQVKRLQKLDESGLYSDWYGSLCFLTDLAARYSQRDGIVGGTLFVRCDLSLVQKYGVFCPIYLLARDVLAQLHEMGWEIAIHFHDCFKSKIPAHFEEVLSSFMDHITTSLGINRPVGVRFVAGRFDIDLLAPVLVRCGVRYSASVLPGRSRDDHDFNFDYGSVGSI